MGIIIIIVLCHYNIYFLHQKIHSSSVTPQTDCKLSDIAQIQLQLQSELPIQVWLGL